MAGEKRFGIIGVGQIATDLVRGMRTEPAFPEPILLSPRGQETAQRLVDSYPGVSIARHNQEVVDGSDVVFLSVRPDAATSVLRELRFRPGQLLISLVAISPVAVLRELASPARVVRAVPLPTVSQRDSPTLVHPGDPEAVDLFERLGRAVPLDDEVAYDAATAVTAFIKPTYLILGEMARWMEGKGVPADVAAGYAIDHFHGLIGVVRESGADQLASLAEGAATPGGLTHQATELLRQAGAFESVAVALEAVLGRLRSAAEAERIGE